MHLIHTEDHKNRPLMERSGFYAADERSSSTSSNLSTSSSIRRTKQWSPQPQLRNTVKQPQTNNTVPALVNSLCCPSSSVSQTTVSLFREVTNMRPAERPYDNCDDFRPSKSITSVAVGRRSNSTPWSPALVRVGQIACQRLLSHNPFLLRKRYFRLLCAWPKVLRRRQGQSRRLLMIRREALKSLVCRHFSKWLHWCVLVNKQREWARIGHAALLRLATVYLRKWHRHWRRKSQIQSVVAPALRAIRGSATRSLMRRTLHKWWLVTERLAQLATLESAAIWQHLRWAFHRWRRRRFAAEQMHYCGKLQRKALRAVARTRFHAWLTFTVRKGLSRWLEQKNLKCVLQRYWYTWSRRARCVIAMAPLRRRVALSRAVTAFCKWEGWLRRLVRSVVLEQRHLIVLLQRYFIHWRLDIEERRLHQKLSYAYVARPLRSASAPLQAAPFAERSTSNQRDDRSASWMPPSKKDSMW